MALSTISYEQQLADQRLEEQLAFVRAQREKKAAQKESEQGLAVRLEQLESEVQKLKDIVLK